MKGVVIDQKKRLESYQFTHAVSSRFEATNTRCRVSAALCCAVLGAEAFCLQSALAVLQPINQENYHV